MRLRGLPAKRKKCVAYINDKYGRNVVHANSGHVVIAEYLVNLGLFPHSGVIGKKDAAKIICGFCEMHQSVATPTPKKIKPKQTRAASEAFLASWEWRTLRFEVLKEFGRRCMCCGATPDDGVTVIHVDHIKPRHKFPELALKKDNLQVLCAVCNQGKGAWDETDFRDCEIEYTDSEEMRYQLELAATAKMLQ